MGREFTAWETSEAVANEVLTLHQLRDGVVHCLYATQGERFGKSRADLGLDTSAAAVRMSAENIVRLAFHTVGGSFDAPTLKTLGKVIDLMAERALNWGAPADEVFAQHCAMTRHLGRLALMHDPGQMTHSTN